ncbi:MAG: LysE family transporter [Caulobacteraceae bacterium]|nr:LysE family transporter [Caulobacteraceae bacterium]
MLVLEAFLFGLTIAAAVGPIALLVLNYGLRLGPWAGFRAGAGAASADFIYAVAALAVGAAVAQTIGPYRRVFEIVAALALVVFAAWMAWGVLRPAPDSEARPTAPRPYLTTLALTVVNPLTIVLFLGFTGHIPPQTPPVEQAFVAVALGLGSLIVQSAFALGGAGLGRVLSDPRWIRRLNLSSALGIAAFGAWGLLKALA